MADWSMLGSGGKTLDIGFDSATSLGKLVALGANDSVGSYTELISASNNTQKSSGISLNIHQLAAVADANVALLDLAIGGTGTEKVIVADILATVSQQPYGRANHIFFPIEIPEGVRIAIRGQNGATTAQNIAISGHLTAIGLSQSPGLNRVTTYGTDSTNSKGIAVARGGTVNTLGAWIEIVASTANPIKALIVSGQSNNDLSNSNISIAADISVGANGSELAIIERIVFLTSALEDSDSIHSQVIPCSIPAGTRLCIRTQASLDNIDANLNFTIYGVD